MVSGVKKSLKGGRPKSLHKNSQIINQSKTRMADQATMNEVITKAVEEARRVAIQAIAVVQSQRSEGQQGPKLGGPALKQPLFNWEATDRYIEWKAFILEVKKHPIHI